jgi:1-aminocyclopropane-1-carboxylate deaminase/D-cysteine desulfhydrase-like pyridoxal-dependent ACC family enzyme
MRWATRVYTGKTIAGLIGPAPEGSFTPDERVLLLHAGELPSLFAYESALLGDGALPP